MTFYMLAEPQQSVLKEVFSGTYQKPQIDYLFADIDTVLPKDLSPLLIQDNSASKQQLQKTLEKHSGLLITTSHPKEKLLAQLRHILIVYFKSDQTGVFRYYDPYIASYFFPSLNEQETVNWLGPIATIEWFNTDWRNKVKQPDQWQQKHNLQVNQWQADTNKLNTKPVLTNNQMLALQDMQEEKYAYHWQQDPQLNSTHINIDTTIYWVKQGLKEGFTQKQSLNRYLAIRANYPNTPLPESWPSEVIAERLLYLADHLQKVTI